jgi:molecular chaperone IbpA
MNMTTIPSLFDLRKTFDPFSVGFESILDEIKNVQKNLPSYPPYNIRKVKENTYIIEMAVAGFTRSDLEVTLDGNKLVVRGHAQDGHEEESYLFKGIANRNFTRTFTLADKIEIKDAEIVNGMLKIWLENLVNTQNNLKKIAIKDPS